jgi:hypothetical protein
MDFMDGMDVMDRAVTNADAGASIKSMKSI